jgi:hypothetical protein
MDIVDLFESESGEQQEVIMSVFVRSFSPKLLAVDRDMWPQKLLLKLATAVTTVAVSSLDSGLKKRLYNADDPEGIN